MFEEGQILYFTPFRITSYNVCYTKLLRNEIIRIRENSFEAIVEELQIYNLSTTSDDVKGIAFEQFLGKTFRGELGQFFTPRTIVDFIVEVLDPQENEVICDPCCGSGGFLIKAFEYVRSKIENEIHLAKEKIKAEYYNEAYDNSPDDKKEAIRITSYNVCYTKLLRISSAKYRLLASSKRACTSTNTLTFLS